MATTALTINGDAPVWTGIINGNQGAPWALRPNRSAGFMAVGTWGSGGSVRLEGSNDGTNWYALSPTALTAAGFFAALGVMEYPKFIRPNVTAGDGTTVITVTGNPLTVR